MKLDGYSELKEEFDAETDDLLNEHACIFA